MLKKQTNGQTIARKEIESIQEGKERALNRIKPHRSDKLSEEAIRSEKINLENNGLVRRKRKRGK
jgi:hypothetical protein